MKDETERLPPSTTSRLPCEIQPVTFRISELHSNFQYALMLTIFHDAFRMWWLVYSKFTTDVGGERIMKIS